MFIGSYYVWKCERVFIFTKNDDKGNKGFDLLKIPEASDFVFEKIIVTYANNGVFYFARNTKDYDGVIKHKLQQKYKFFFGKNLIGGGNS